MNKLDFMFLIILTILTLNWFELQIIPYLVILNVKIKDFINFTFNIQKM